MCNFLLITFGILGVIGAIVIGVYVSNFQTKEIRKCLDIKKLHNDLLVGEKIMSDLVNADILSLKNPIYTHVGFGGVGPRYHPCFEIMKMVDEELTQRRNKE